MDLITSLKRAFNPSYYYTPVTFYTPIANSAKNIFVDGYRNNVAINICSGAIADKVAIIPINIYKTVKVGEGAYKDVLKDDFRYKILHYEPNGYTTAYAFWHTMELNKQRYGNSYAVIHKFSETKTISLELIHPSLLVDKPFFDKGILKYTFSSDNGNRTYDASQILHFKRESIDGIMGRDPYDVLHEEVKRTYLANKTITNYYENDGKSTKFLKTTATVGDIAKLDKAVNKFRKQTGGSYFDENNKLVSGNIDNVVSFPELPGNGEIQESSNNQNHDLYNAVIQDCNLKIAAHYRIPPHILNILQAQKNSNVETLQLDFNVSTIQYSLRSNRQELEMKLLSTDEKDNGYSIEYNTMAVVELDHEVRMRGYESLQKTAMMTPNEVREIEGMKPIPGGDSHYIFNQFTTLEGLNADSSVN
jgi:HK97 family phage portal protein